MKRGSISFGTLLLVALLSGCSMCRNPFDYCSPVIGESGCPNCDFGARKGSIFAPFSDDPQMAATGPTPAGEPEEVTGEFDGSPSDFDPNEPTDDATMR